MGSFLSVALACCCLASSAQIPVRIDTNADDIVGRRVAFNLREVVASSKQFDIGVVKSKPKLVISLITLATPVSEDGIATVYSAAFTWDDPDNPAAWHLSHIVGSCGGNRVRSCAESIAAEAAQLYEQRVRSKK